MKHLLSFLLLLTAALSLTAQSRDKEGDVDLNQMRKLQWAQFAIANFYVDSVDQAKLTENAINGMLEKLDPHSSYTNAEETRKLNEPLEGNFGGIGVQFNLLDDSLIVIQTTPNGPSQKAGILAGDRIISVNGTSIAGVKMSRDSIMKKLRGPEGTKAYLGVVRRGVKKTLFFDVVRGSIPMPTLDAYYMVEPGIGYLHLERFGATSGKEVQDALRDLKGQGMKSLILDLQMNGGGYLEAANQIAGEFLNAGDLVVYTEGRQSPKRIFTAHGGGLFTEGKLIVLVDEYSASASEILAGAVQDHDRGTIIGRRTYGKGLVQRPVELPDHSMIRLTVAHYYTPSGRCIQKPYVKGHKEDYEKDVENRYLHGEFVSEDSIRLDSSKVYKTLRLGRTVYGGGGVMPDLFVPMDTTKVTPYYSALRRTGLLNEEVLRYVDRNRLDLKRRYKDFAAFDADFEVPQALIDTLVAKGREKKAAPKDDDELQRTLPDLRYILKGSIAYDLWDRNEYFRYMNRRNDIVKAAIEEARK